ncbi:glucose-6-phosphate isomerase [Guyparkeria halophila]|uniref:Glucose-6-phosphate isomerase n=1 Tax=Guyparkeria halophila TaxID=47960 RepID=A0ABZ0YWD7_9GAMM|nr:glucose-6-phosphate isomerase [Guyparkeria halophila]WQH15500.1 glucose-6-phosphate isomerase [Guyparkeria halophila]
MRQERYVGRMSPIWQLLEVKATEHMRRHPNDWFQADGNRAARLSGHAAGLSIDYSKQRVTDDVIDGLLALAEERGVLELRDDMFNGVHINGSEDRAVLHVALRNRSNRPICFDDKDVMPEVNAVLDHMETFVDSVQSGEWRGYAGDPITDVVNIGVGGSDLGTRMVCRALGSYADRGIRVHFVSNIAPSDLASKLAVLDPKTTLFVVASKSFGTQETLANARSARRWFLESAPHEEAIKKHFVAVSTHTQRVRDFGIDPDNMFPIWDWVGGRYSLWSAIGLPIALFLGMDRFKRLLDGAHALDEHFRLNTGRDNLPLILGLIDVWNADFLGSDSLAVFPYGTRLGFLPAHLQQVMMESNGKRVRIDGQPVDSHTSAVLWGGLGTNGQHAFYQLLHQGTRLIPSDFISAIRTHSPIGSQQQQLLANLVAQSRALMLGREREDIEAQMRAEGADEATIARIAPHRVCPGGQPSNTILFPQMTPEAVGALLALYEHRVFVAGAVWQIDSFDQWGVELGKQMANELEPFVGSDLADDDFDGSTRWLLDEIRQHWTAEQSGDEEG